MPLSARVKTLPRSFMPLATREKNTSDAFMPLSARAKTVPLQMHLCGEASSHLQDMKDELLQISEELLDDDGEMDPKLSEELRTKR